MIWRGQADGQTVEADDAGRQGRRGGFTARRSGRGLGAAPSDEADRMATGCRPAGALSLYGRDCAGMLGNYAAYYAERELFMSGK